MFVYSCNLREYRNAICFTQKDLAEAVGCSKNTISNIESGTYNPTVVLASKIANFFGCYIEDIFFKVER